MHIPSLRAHLAILAICSLYVNATIAQEVTLPELRVSFSLPSTWKHQVSQVSGRTFVLLKPNVDAKVSVALRCRIERHDLPAAFKDYTQSQLNDAYVKNPLSRTAFAAQLSQLAGVPVVVEQTGTAKFDEVLTYWALSTSSQTVGGTTANFMTKNYLAQTPGYAWNVQCGAAVTDSTNVTDAYRKAEREFEYFLSSIRLK